MATPVDYNQFIANKKIQLNEHWLRQHGVVPKDKAHAFRLEKKLYTELEKRVGQQLAGGMSDEQFDAFKKVQADGDNSETLKVLGRIRPDHAAVVAQCTAALGEEVSAAIDATAFIEHL